MCFVVASLVMESFTIEIVETLSLLNSASPFEYLHTRKVSTKTFLNTKQFSSADSILSGTSGKQFRIQLCISPMLKFPFKDKMFIGLEKDQ
jgi:hypothetical protein